ncbi:MAG TPA: DUF5615 family PIN-like protein [Bryobacteraceae bacterium]|nr:DUF5615 family PIN-like protein [Bryobacteraceae bacterium]
MTTPKLLADADLNHKIVAGLRRAEPTIDFLNARDGGTVGLTDPEILALAAGTSRVLVSHDSRTMTAHFAEFTKSRSSPGLIIVRQDLSLRRAIEDLLLICLASDAGELENRVRWIPI